MDYDDLEWIIAKRFFFCNEMTEKQALDYAWIAVDVLKNSGQQLISMPPKKEEAA